MNNENKIISYVFEEQTNFLKKYQSFYEGFFLKKGTFWKKRSFLVICIQIKNLKNNPNLLVHFSL